VVFWRLLGDMPLPRIRTDRKLQAKVVAGLGVAVAAQNPLPAVMPIAEMLGSAEHPADTRLRKRVKSRFASNSKQLRPAERDAVLLWAEDAVRASGYDAKAAVGHSLSEVSAADHVASYLDSGLNARENAWASLAVRTYMREYIENLAGDPARLLAALAPSIAEAASPPQREATLSPAEMAKRGAQALVETVQSRALRSPIDRSTGHPVFVRNALEAALPDAKDEWASRLRIALRDVVDAARSDGARRASRPLVTLADFAALRPTLASWSQLRSPAIQDALRECRALDRRDRGHFHPRSAAALEWLEEATTAPQFRVVVAIHGTWGSGKSRLVDEFAASAVAGERVLVVLVDRSAGSVEQTLRTAFESATSTELATWEQVLNVTRDFDRVWFVIDDADVVLRSDPGWVDQLSTVMTSSLSAPVRWLLTVDSYSIPEMMRTRTPVWEQLGLAHEEAVGNVRGWFDLDEHNVKHRVGSHILASALDSHVDGGESLVPDSARGLAGDYLRAREHPLTCVLRAQLNRDAPSDEFHYGDLFSEYWALARHDRASRGHANPDLVDAVVRVIAADLLLAAPTPLAIPADAIDRVSLPDSMAVEWSQMDSAERSDAVNAATKALLKTGILANVDGLAKPSMRTATLWGYLLTRDLDPDSRSGQQLAAGVQLPADVQGVALSAWDIAFDTITLLYLDRQHYAAPAARFLLHAAADGLLPAAPGTADMTADRRLPSKPPNLWHRGLDESGFPSSVIWQTSASLPFGYLMGIVKHALHTAPSADDTYWILRLLRLRRPVDQNLRPALNLVRRQFPYLVPSGLSDYAAKVLGDMAATIDWRHHQGRGRILDELNELDRRLVASAVAVRIVSAVNLRDDRTLASWLRTLRDFLERIEDPVAEAGIGDADFSHMPFWLALVRATFDELAKDAAADTFLDALDGAGWWELPRSGAGWLIRRETQTALGHTAGNNRKKFLEVVTTLAARKRTGSMPPHAQPVAAAYAIKHSTRTGGRVEYRVRSELEPVVRRLQRDVPPIEREMLGRLRFVS
jgi:hypothetical protein